MNFRARGRIKVWTLDFAAWAQAAWKEHEHDDESGYYLGVISGITAARTNYQPPPVKMGGGMDEGYRDARLLINKVLAFGDAPSGTYDELLAEQRQTADGIPAQEIWDRGKRELAASMQLLNEDYESVTSTGTTNATPERLELIVGKLLEATMSFDELAERGANLDLVQPLAAACRQVTEGLLNGDGDALHEGRKAIVAIMLPIEEESERRQRES